MLCGKNSAIPWNNPKCKAKKIEICCISSAENTDRAGLLVGLIGEGD